MRRRGGTAAVVSLPPEPRFAPNGYRLPDPIREGEILTDVTKKQWRLGRSIGLGGFGEIYLASDNINRPVGQDSQHVIKVEPHKNGPLFVEMNFYLRVAKSEKIETWMKERRMKKLGMPRYCGSGSHVYNGEKYRFLVLPRFGVDLHKLFEKYGRRFHTRTVLSIGIQILEILEYVHAHGYSHSDIKDSNLLLGLETKQSGQIYLLDYGLASKFVDRIGQHKEYRQDARKAHDGTIEFTSRDAHIGAHSRRSDMEILGYNMLQWVCGKLPWEDDLSDPEKVAERKREFMNNIPRFLRLCFPNDEPPSVLEWYLKYVAGLSFESKPNYALCKQMLRKEINKLGFTYNGNIIFDSAPTCSKTVKSKSRKRAAEEPENFGKGVQKKMGRNSARQPCAQQNSNRLTRNSMPSQRDLRSHQQFSWEQILLSDPEKQFRVQAERLKQNKLKRKRLLSATALLEENGSLDPVGNLVKDALLSPATALQLATDAESLKNPTPAMLEQMARMRMKRENTSPTCSTKGKTKSDSRCSSPVDNPNALTPAMEGVIRRREAHFLNFHYAESDSEDDSCAESSGSESVPVRLIRLPPRGPSSRIMLRKRPSSRRLSYDTDSSNSDSAEFLSRVLVPNKKRRQATRRLRNSKLPSRQFSNGVNFARKKSHAITKKYLRSFPNLRNSTLQG